MTEHWFRARRKELNLSQEELAARLQLQGIDITTSSISHWETGRYIMPLDNPDFRKALASALKMSIPAILIAAGYEVTGEYSEAAQHAAEIVERLPPDRQTLALGILKQLLEH